MKQPINRSTLAGNQENDQPLTTARAATAPPQRRNVRRIMAHLDSVSEAVSICALRFLGYEYEESAGIAVPGVTGGGIGTLIEPIVESLTLHNDQNHNFAAFFGL